MKRALASLATAAMMLAGSANAGELVIIFDDLNPGPKAAFEKVVADFDATNPDISVNLSINDREAHKTAIICLPHQASFGGRNYNEKLPLDRTGRGRT